MTEQLIETQEPSAPDTSHSSRTSRSAAGWVDCVAAASVTDLYRPGYKPRSLSWISPRPLWEARNDRIVRVLGDPTNNERTRWVAAMRAKGNIDPDLIVRRYAEAETLSFMILGDPGEGDDSQYHVLRPLYATAGGTAFTYIVSDVIYPAGDVNEYEDKFFWPYRNLPGPIYAIPGNHDWYDGLHGFMTHFCAADPDKRPKASKGRFFGRILRKALWREPNPMEQDLLERVGPLRQERSDQPGPYFAMEVGPILLVGIDPGILGTIDAEQGEWLRKISRHDKPKILLTGKPLVVDAKTNDLEIDGGGGVREIVDNAEHRYIAVIGGDIHNYQRYPIKMPGGQTIQHIVSGAAGAYTKATHKIPKLKAEEVGCTEEEFRCYPRRGDSLAAYSRLYDRRFFRNKGYMVVPYSQAPAIMKRLLEGEVEPSRSEDAQEEITQQAWKAAKRITKLPGHGGPFHESFSEILDWNDPPPPLFKSFLRVEVKPERARDPVLRGDRLRGARGQSSARGLAPRQRAGRRHLEVGGAA